MWLSPFCVFAPTLGIHSADHHRYAGDEPRYLLMARSIASDGDIDLRNQYARREYRSFYSGTLRTNGRVIAGRLAEPQPAGVSVLIAPAYALGGGTAAELLIAALAALAFVLAAALARRLVPEPWATAAPPARALSPPPPAHRRGPWHRARAFALARGQVPGPGGARPARRVAVGGAPRPRHPRARRGRGAVRVAGRLRDGQRRTVRGPAPLRSGSRRQADRGRAQQQRRVRPPATARFAVVRPGRRAAALGPGL